LNSTRQAEGIPSKTVRRNKHPQVSDAPSVRSATFEDYGKIATLAAKYDLRIEREEEWRHLWLNNPAYDSSQSIGWILESSGDLVGFIGNIPLHYWLQGSLIRTASPRCWVVDERYRTFALLLSDTLLSQPQVDLALSTTGNQMGSAAFRAAGGIPVPQALQKRAAFWVTNYSRFAKVVLAWKRIPASPLLQPILAAALRIRANLVGRPPKLESAIERQFEFGESFEPFWGKLLALRADVLLGSRDRKTLEWHFHHALRSGNAWILTATRDQRLLAYAVFLRRDIESISLHRMLLADFQELEPGYLPQLLSSAISHARREKLDVVEIPASRFLDSPEVQRMAPHWRSMSEDSLTYFYKANGNLAAKLDQEIMWDMTFFDGDSSLTELVIDA
jgi:hypothetical protein